MKIATDLEQSKKLVELGIDMNTADFAWYESFSKSGYSIRLLNKTYPLDIIENDEHNEIPAWSLSALLSALPKYPFREYNLVVTDGKPYVAFDDCSINLHDDFFGEDFIDACYNMIITLHKMDVL